MEAEFRAEVSRLKAEFNTPGLAVEMLTNGKRYSAYEGRLAVDSPRPVTGRTRFGTVCLIKLLVAIKVLMMAERGDIALDSPIADYLPELARGDRAKGKIIIVRHLLSHTGGFRSFTVSQLLPKAHESWENCVRLLHDTDPLFRPGTVFNDEHLSHIILGQLIERRTGKSFMDVIRADVLAPVGIKPGNRTQDADHPDVYAFRHRWNADQKRWLPEDDVYSQPDPAFGAISHLSLTSLDLMKLGEALLPNSPVFSSWVKDSLFKQEIAVPRAVHPHRITRWHVSGFGLGLATFKGGHQGFVTTGRGQNSCIIFTRDRKTIIALAMNAMNVLEREALLNNLLAKFAGDTSIIPEARTLDIGFDEFIAPFTTRDIGGMYLGFQPDPVEIFANPRGFVVRVRGEDRYQFEASPENRLIMRAKLPTSVGLFKDPGTQQPTLMMAMNAFRKIK